MSSARPEAAPSPVPPPPQSTPPPPPSATPCARAADRSTPLPSPADSPGSHGSSADDADAAIPWPAGRPIDEWNMSASEVRQVVRLVQCPICSLPLRAPHTLPCGGTLCKACIPDTHPRVHISYPATASRRRGFNCPFAACAKEHSAGDCSPNVVLSKAIAVATAEYDRGRRAAVESGLVTRLSASAASEDASEDVRTTLSEPLGGFPASVPKELPGGRLMAAYLMAERGSLRYETDLRFEAGQQLQALVDLDAAILAAIERGTRPEMDCQVCLAIFVDPITTPCGHTFCRVCLLRTLDHGRHCPMCRHELRIDPGGNPSACRSNELLQRITTAFWVDLVEARRHTASAEARGDSSGSSSNLAVFVCTLAFPSMPTFLHIFEPRYRLMVRRALQGDRTFGMVWHHDGAELGTVLRITNYEFFPDGRILIETTGVSRFRILERGELDGYVTARVQRISDVSIAEEEELEALETRQDAGATGHAPGAADTERRLERSPSTSSTAPPTLFGGLLPAALGARASRVRAPQGEDEVQTMPTQELMDFAADFVRRMRGRSVGWLPARVMDVYGECPDDPALFPWWFANVLPVRDTEKYRLLGTTSVRQRLKICCVWILEWEANRWSFSGCVTT